ncbi:hypothetical protein V3C99_009157, partial [Haemonchus contortus]|uniref:BEACH domain-containing protein n=1 Tax=Haemonchus contortus TaxID=6289 RepID=A0A7I4YL95_HAECO
VSLTPRFKVQHRGDIKRSHSPPTVVCGEIGFYPIQRWSLKDGLSDWISWYQSRYLLRHHECANNYAAKN